MYAVILGFITGFTLTYSIIPVIIRVARERRIYDRPNERSSHAEPTPSLGGIGIFAGTICAVVLWTPLDAFGVLQYVLAAFVLIFLIGVLADLIPLSPTKKFSGQLLVAIILAYKSDVRITSLYGVFGIYDIPELASFVLSVVIIIAIINSFNLIDGINGLAGSIGLLACLSLGAWFFVVHSPALAVVAFSLAGGFPALLGARVLIHPGAVLGADGFGLAMDKGHWLKVPQLGGVVIGDDCEIGANTTIDRGAIDDTVIGDRKSVV